MRKVLFLIVIIAGLTMNAAFAASGSSLPPDVGANHWIAGALSTAVQDGWLSMQHEESFRPDAPADRLFIAELISGAWPIAEKQGRAQGSFPAGDDLGVYFKDIDYLDTATKLQLNRLAAAGIMKGYPGEIFWPQRTVTRIEMVAILSRVCKGGDAPMPRFTDGSRIPAWGLPELEKAATAGLVGGYDDGSFRPLQTVSRAEALQMVSRWVYPSKSPMMVSRGAVPASTDSLVVEILRLINVERSKQGLPLLRNDDTLTRIALDKASTMARENYFSHESLGGENTQELFARYGFINQKVGENLLRLKGNVSAEKAVAVWMQSGAHRAIILTPYTDTGIGLARSGEGTIYIAQAFAALQ